jgi:hypothetical protein
MKSAKRGPALSFENSRAARAGRWVGVALLALLALGYCAPALVAPFWGDADSWSNLLPVIHYRRSILVDHALPLYTPLWYGGRMQWQNPLWNFLYGPATAVWLIVSLDWGARIVYAGHLLFSLWAGRKLASRFLASETARLSAAVLLVSPMLPVLSSGHIEKVLGWGWLLLSIDFLLDGKRSLPVRGVCSGLCWGVMALAGDNYHVFYAGLLLLPLALSFRKPVLLLSLLGGACIGLLHWPSVGYLLGAARGYPDVYIRYLSVNFVGLVSSLTMGISNTYLWESWALIGIPAAYWFLRSAALDAWGMVHQRLPDQAWQKAALLLSAVLLSLLATGVLYRGNHLLDTFRIPARATALLAVAVLLYLFFSLPKPAAPPAERTARVSGNAYLLASAVQVAVLAVFLIRPSGAGHSPYDAQAQKLADLLVADRAESVWFSPAEQKEMYISVVLTRNGIALPNVYYGDMGQTVPVAGPYCGYSFDHILVPASAGGTDVELVSDISYKNLGSIPFANLQRMGRMTFEDWTYDVYRVVC